MHRERLQRLFRAMEQLEIDAVALNAGPSLSYLTGLHFHLMERPVTLLAAPGKRPLLILPELEQKKLDQSAYRLDALTYPKNPAGCAEKFTHRTGHGIGMECYEDPYIREDTDQMLTEGTTYTVEPGMYLNGKIGLRREDTVVVTAAGAESLSRLPRGLTTIA